MILPTTIATVASALTIIDLLIRFAGYLSPEVKKGLYEGRNQIAFQNPPTVEAANEIFVKSLHTTLPSHLVDATSQDLTLAIEVVRGFENGVKPRPPKIIPAYGRGLANLFLGVHIGLRNW